MRRHFITIYFRITIFSSPSFQFWEVVASEHDVDYDGIYNGDCDMQLDKINVYFTEAQCENCDECITHIQVDMCSRP